MRISRRVQLIAIGIQIGCAFDHALATDPIDCLQTETYEKVQCTEAGDRWRHLHIKNRCDVPVRVQLRMSSGPCHYWEIDARKSYTVWDCGSDPAIDSACWLDAGCTCGRWERLYGDVRRDALRMMKNKIVPSYYATFKAGVNLYAAAANSPLRWPRAANVLIEYGSALGDASRKLERLHKMIVEVDVESGSDLERIEDFILECRTELQEMDELRREVAQYVDMRERANWISRNEAEILVLQEVAERSARQWELDREKYAREYERIRDRLRRDHERTEDQLQDLKALLQFLQHQVSAMSAQPQESHRSSVPRPPNSKEPTGCGRDEVKSCVFK